MKILFICGSLEPGKDGVGDYARRLACELTKRSHKVLLISLFDAYSIMSDYDIQIQENINLNVLRIPLNTSNKARYEILRKSVNDFFPTIISLQYVPYAFNKYGVPILLGMRLKRMCKNALWHIMVHEPMIIVSKDGLKSYVIQGGQTLSLRFIKYFLRPVIFHTSISHYQKLLATIGIKSHKLGLFGNVFFDKEINQLNSSFSFAPKRITGIYFGNVPKNDIQIEIVNMLSEFISSSGKSVRIIFCGRNGVGQNSFCELLNKVNQVDVNVLGELSTTQIGELYSQADFGISRVPARLIGKSGTAISMLEHGLPLWVPLSDDDEIIEFVDFRAELCFSSILDLFTQKKLPLYTRSGEIAEKFISNIQMLIK